MINDRKIKIREPKKFTIKAQKKTADKFLSFKDLQKKFGKNIINNKKIRIRERGDR